MKSSGNPNYVVVGRRRTLTSNPGRYPAGTGFSTAPPERGPRPPNFLYLADLGACLDLLQSVIIIGSAAYGRQTRGSDVDLVLITKDPGLEAVCEHLFGQEIENSLNGRGFVKKDFTVLPESQTEELFRHGSPFAFAMRHGNVIFDNGYFRELCRRPPVKRPSREYSVKSLFENVASQYYLTLKSLEGAACEKDCSLQCCLDSSDCPGLAPAAMLPKLIFRMLYMVLPNRGIIPLTKADATALAENFYDSESASAVQKALFLARSEANEIRYEDYRALKKLAVKLFREIIATLGLKHDVLEIIRDAARLANGNFAAIKSPQLRNCVV